MLAPVVVAATVDGVPSQFIVSTSFYNLYFLTGVLISYFNSQINFDLPRFAVILSVSLFVTAPFVFDNKVVIWFFTALFFVLYLKANRSNKILRAFGNASYSTYLFHAIVISIGKYMDIDNEILLFVILLILSLTLGHIYYLYVEKPSTYKISKMIVNNK